MFDSMTFFFFSCMHLCTTKQYYSRNDGGLWTKIRSKEKTYHRYGIIQKYNMRKKSHEQIQRRYRSGFFFSVALLGGLKCSHQNYAPDLHNRQLIWGEITCKKPLG